MGSVTRLSFLALAALAAATVLAGCESHECARYRRAFSGNPVADAEAAFARGDRAFRSVYGLGEEAPAVPENVLDNLTVAPRGIEGTSDSGECSQDFNRDALEYARLYNERMVQLQREQ
jgi:hypothetical protein